MTVCSPGTESTGEGAMQTFPSPVIESLLLPKRDVGAIISSVLIKCRQRSSEENIGRFLAFFVGSARPFASHHADSTLCSTLRHLVTVSHVTAEIRSKKVCM